MSWVQNKLRARHVAAAFILLSAGAASADILVVRSTGPSAKSFPPGKSLPESGSITLKQNDSLIVLDGRGTRTLRGPGTFSPGGPSAAAARSSLSALTGTGQQRRARIGAVRSVAAIPRSPSIWHVDIAKSSTICLADPAKVQLWRADAAQPATLTITRSGDPRPQTLQWAAGESTIAWPAAVPIAESAAYQLSWAGAGVPTTLKFRRLSARPAGLEEMASSLIQNGCEAQLDLLIDTVRLPDEGETAG